jgi:PAS domain S-box-containing protein
MSDPALPAARKARQARARGPEGPGSAGWQESGAALPGLLACALATVLLVVVASGLAWQALGHRPLLAALATLLLVAVGGVALVLLRRQVRQATHDVQALAAFAQHLRRGDVGAALRAVRADSPRATTVWGDDTVVELGQASAPPSQFDVHAREIEVALGERERRWQSRMRLSADWHWETDAALVLNWVSQDLSSLVKLGVQPSDLIGHRLDDVPLFDPPEGGWSPVIERMAQRKALREVQIEVRRRGRSQVWVALNARAHFDDEGQFTGYEGVGRDITEERIAMLRLADSERRHAMMAELAADWYWQSDAQHHIVEVGPVARALVGDRIDQVIGRPRWEAFAEGASDAEWAAHRADLDAHRPFRGFEFSVRQSGQALRWVSVSGLPRLDARQQFIGYHGVGRDITLKKRAERLLLTRNEQLERLVHARTAELEQSNRDLEAFARQLAHELRTPISQVVGLTDLLKSTAWERLLDTEREWLRLAGQSAREMSHTVTALLELARSTSTALLLEPVDLSALAASVIAELPWLERASPVQWAVEPGLEAHCSAPLARVVLTNLLGNAAKFTRDAADPRVSFERGDDGAFVVRDNGAGFDAGQADALFQPFVRLHRADQFQGTGLGLSIVRRIIERHGGSISATGSPQRGASFVFRFTPARPAAAADDSRDVAA